MLTACCCAGKSVSVFPTKVERTLEQKQKTVTLVPTEALEVFPHFTALDLLSSYGELPLGARPSEFKVHKKIASVFLCHTEHCRSMTRYEKQIPHKKLS